MRSAAKTKTQGSGKTKAQAAQRPEPQKNTEAGDGDTTTTGGPARTRSGAKHEQRNASRGEKRAAERTAARQGARAARLRKNARRNYNGENKTMAGTMNESDHAKDEVRSPNPALCVWAAADRSPPGTSTRSGWAKGFQALPD